MRAYIGERVAQRLRRELFDHLLNVRLADLEQFNAGEHVYRLTSSCGKIGVVRVGNHLPPRRGSIFDLYQAQSFDLPRIAL